MAISKRLRFEIFRRDNHTCRYCGASAPGVVLVVDHVMPRSLGGKPEPSNLVTACEPCNNGKTSITPDSPVVDDVRRDAIRWARAMEAAAEIHRAKREAREAYVAYFIALWNDWGYGPNKQTKLPLDDDWHSGIERFFEYGLEPDDLAYAVRTAMQNNKVVPERTYRYFCGICWNMLKDLRETASDIVMAEVEDEINTGLEFGA